VFLGCQPYSGPHFNTGRETFMLPVTWTDGWPVILPPNTPVPISVKKPNLPAGPGPVLTTGDFSYTDHFDGDALAFRWVGIRQPQGQWWAISKAAKSLFLQPRAVRLNGNSNPSYLGVRQQNNDFSVTVSLKAQATTANCVAGLAAFQDDNHFYALNVKIDSGKLTEISVEQPAAGGRGTRGGGAGGPRGGPRGGGTQTAPATPPARSGAMVPNVLGGELIFAGAPGGGPAPAASQPAPTKLPDNTTAIDLKIEGHGPVTRFFYKIANGPFSQVGQDLPSSFLSTETAGGFQGVTVGVFAHD
jgi:beta-xylosidase